MPGKLVATAGPASGEEFELLGDEAVIGRSTENAISIPDTSVSRKHVLLRKTASGWAASDMGSGNGTLVNGSAIAEERLLKQGDLIALGDTELRYEDGTSRPGARREPLKRGSEPAAIPVNTGGRTRAVVRTSRKGAVDLAELKARRNKLILRAGLAVVVVVGGAVGWRLVQAQRDQIEGQRQSADRERLQAARAMKQHATNLIREGKWKEAKDKLVELQQTFPDFETVQAAQLLAAAEKEIPNQERLLECQDAISRGEIAAAARALEQVSVDTVQYKPRDRLRDAIDRRIVERINDARALLGSTSDVMKMQELKALVEDVLVARPEHRDALAYKTTADQAIERIQHPPPKFVAPDQPWLEVQARFHTGDLSGSLAMAEACSKKFAPCRKLKQQIQDFVEGVKNMEGYPPAKLLALIELDRTISGGSASPLTRTVTKKAADAFYVKAANARTAGNLGLAIEFARKALSAEPGHPGASAMIAEARAKAKDIYLQAYTEMHTSPEEALKLFKEVVAMTPKDDEWHQKAEARIRDLST